MHLTNSRFSRYSRITFIENAISNSPKITRSKSPESDRLLCIISIIKFGSFKNLFATITNLSAFPFQFRCRIILLVQGKKWFQAAGNHGDEWGLIWCFWWGIYTPIQICIHAQTEAPSLKKSSHRASLKWTQRFSQFAPEYYGRNHAIERDIPFSLEGK